MYYKAIAIFAIPLFMLLGAYFAISGQTYSSPGPLLLILATGVFAAVIIASHKNKGTSSLSSEDDSLR